ncbi:MAG: single-stranded-DNA-specific exonuclease RecJ, partial [Phascolarctobacterium sp.]|nr:single-stranded-DNA-specific exonuclease RecJ [Phascolarctobacterium sp.]
MFGKQKIWDIQEYNKEKAGFYAAELGISPLVTGVLLERGFNDVDAMRDFLYGSKEPFYNPFLLKGMDATVERVERALANGEQITVYGDYDVDGITASSLLYIYLERRGAKVNTYIPKRKSEGYGLNDDALKSIFESGTTLVITVDCGISGLHEVEQAPKGLDIILTDHHTVPVQLPPAYAIINPKQEDCDYPFKDLSGVGVAFKLCQALEQKRTGTDVYWEDLTELAALGTVADIVPLLGENRELVRRGLKAMEHTSLVGLRALITASGCSCENISSENIGFILAPRLNAVGRLEHAQSAVELLVTQDAEKAEAIALELNRENALRQEISRSIMEEAEALLAKEEHIDTAIVLASEGWHQGVVGIVASRLVDKYHLPTILISISDGMAKGSCRSIPALNLYEAIAAESDILTQFGGHHQAAGLTMPADKVEEFKERFRTYV